MPVGAGGSGPAKTSSPVAPGAAGFALAPRPVSVRATERSHQSSSRATTSGQRGTSARTNALPAFPIRAARS